MGGRGTCLRQLRSMKKCVRLNISVTYGDGTCCMSKVRVERCSLEPDPRELREAVLTGDASTFAGSGCEAHRSESVNGTDRRVTAGGGGAAGLCFCGTDWTCERLIG